MKYSVIIGSMFMLWVQSCRQSPKLKDFSSELAATSMCPLNRPNAPYLQVPRTGRVKIPGVMRQPAQAPTAADFGINNDNIPPVFSKDSTIFGVEIEIPVKGLIKEGSNAKVSFELALLDKLVSCKLGQLSWTWDENAHKFWLVDSTRTPNKIHISFKTDPGVVEITTTPLTYVQTESWQNILEELIFATARELVSKDYAGSAEFQRNRWSGHLNVSWPGLMTSMATNEAKEAFERPYSIMKLKYRLSSADINQANMDLLLNFFTNMQNHPELGMGLLGGDVRNAPPLALGSKEEQDILRNIIREYKARHVQSVEDLAKRLYKAEPVSFRGKYKLAHYSFVNLESLLWPDHSWGFIRGSRMELRGFFSPLSVNEMLANYRIVNGMLDNVHRNYRLKDNKVMAYQPPEISETFKKAATLSNFKVQGLTGGLSPSRAVDAYLAILKEAELDPFKEYIYIRDTIVREAVKKRLNRCSP